MNKAHRLLITRADRLGDVLMSLHSVRRVRQNCPDAKIDFLVRKELEGMFRPLLDQWNVRMCFSLEELGQYDGALCLFEEPAVLNVLKKANVPVRVGNFSKFSSFLKLTHGIRQNRGQGAANEGEYNLALARLFLTTLGAPSSYLVEPLRLPVNLKAASEARKALEQISLDPGGPFWVAHPGMGGSALNLGAEAYVDLLSRVALEVKGQLVLTLGPARADLELVESILNLKPDWRVLPQVSLAALGEAFRLSECVVAPSTGPLHLAHYVGATTLGVYSPVRSHQPARWAPWGGAGLSKILAPKKPCPGKRACVGSKCPSFYCLDRMVATGLPSPLLSGLNAL
jgi:ADP-heptose:LPS heptosyltransferase